MGKKNIYVAYFLWLIGGYAGLHLLYLGRDRQAFLYWTTFGGYFGIALIKDLFSIPFYVRDANNDPSVLAKLALMMHRNEKPPFSVLRFVSQMVIGNSWSYLWMAALPENDDYFGEYFRHLKYLGPLAAALGIWMVGNVGRREGSFKWAAIGACVVLPFALFEPSALNLSSISSATFFEWKGKKWRRKMYSDKSLCRRVTTLSFGWLLFCSMWAMYIYFNGEVTLDDGQTVKLKHVITRFFNSPMYAEFKNNLKTLFDDARTNGIRSAWYHMMELLDPFGEHHALKVLDLQKGVGQETLKARYKQLSKEWHPDRHKGDEEKERAQTKFIEIANAYEVLSTMKKQRMNKSQQSSVPQDDEFDEFVDEL